MTSEANKRANAKYKREKTKAYTFRFSISTDTDVINRIESAPNKRGYIRSLILSDIARDSKQ